MSRTIRIVLANVALALALTACGTGATAGDAAAVATTPAASTSNLSADSAAPPAAPGGAGDESSAPAPEGADLARRGPGVMGQVTAVDGMQLTVANQRQQGETTVVLTDSTQIFTQASGDMASVPVGALVMAVGSQEGDSFSATQIRVTTSDAAAGAPGLPAGPDGQGGQGAPGGPAGQGAPGSPGGPAPADASGAPDTAARLMGTVAAATDDALTVTAEDGSTITVRLASDGQVVQQVAGSLADITVGTWVSVQGEPGDTALTATRVAVLPEQPATP